MLREDDFLYPDEDDKRIKRAKKKQSKTVLDIKKEIRRLDSQICKVEYEAKRSKNENQKKNLEETIVNLYDERKMWFDWIQDEANVQHPQRRFHTKYRKRTKEKAYQMVKARVEEIRKDPAYKRKFVTKEDTAKRLNIPESQVEQAFHRMNLEGILSQAIHRYPHDNDRNPWDGGGFSGWQSDIYEILEGKEK